MLRELKRVATISGMILTFLVTFFAIYYHQSNRSDALQQTSEKPCWTNSDPMAGSGDAINMESNEAEDEKSSEENLEEIVDENKVKTTEYPTRKYLELKGNEREIYSRFSNLFAVLVDEEVQANGKVRNKTNWRPSDYQHENLFRKMMPIMLPIIEILNLENKTQEEIKKEIYVDFSTLDTNKMQKDERLHAKVLLNCYAVTFQVKKARSHIEKLHPSDRSKYDLRRFNGGIIAVGVENFMKAAIQFCKDEAAAGEIPIVSIGSGDGTVEKGIIAEYRKRFGREIRIQLVDPDSMFNRIVDFKTVDHLITENPRIVGNCVAFIIWPNPDERETEEKNKDDYDIEAIRKLQPKAVLAVYECTGASGSHDFRTFLYDDSLDDIPAVEFGARNWQNKIALSKKQSYGLDNYVVREVARQNVFLPRSGTLIFRVVKIKRTN